MKKLGRVLFVVHDVYQDDNTFPQWALFPIEKYATCFKFFGHEAGDRYMALSTSRGCVNRCNFCYRIEKGIRLRSIESIIEEIKTLNKDYGRTYSRSLRAHKTGYEESK